MTKDKAITNAKYLIQRTGKPCFIYRVRYYWCFTGADKETAQLSYEDEIKDYQEVTLDG